VIIRVEALLPKLSIPKKKKENYTHLFMEKKKLLNFPFQYSLYLTEQVPIVNYIICRNVEIFKKEKFQRTIFL
jgi:hypothetical protein